VHLSLERVDMWNLSDNRVLSEETPISQIAAELPGVKATVTLQSVFFSVCLTKAQLRMYRREALGGSNIDAAAAIGITVVITTAHFLCFRS